MDWIDQKSEIQPIDLPLFEEKKVRVSILREDKLHPYISGNKFRKLKYNILEANRLGVKTILTFGGAYSNHIAATAAAGKSFGFKTIGVIRGEEIEEKIDQNPTLLQAQKDGMQFKFISRAAYRNKENPDFLNDLKHKFGEIFILPEGGTNTLAVKGCEEILDNRTDEFDTICCTVGTSGTISGIINSLKINQITLGFPALKNANFLHNEIKKYTLNTNYELINTYHFNGYAKVSAELINFVTDFYQKTEIPLDLIYTGKMMFGIMDLIKNDYFAPNSKILVIHTGGLQGNKGFGLDLV